MLPKELFDSAGDNLLQNALRKRRLDESVAIRATFRCNDTIEFSVCDSGAPVAAEVLRGLMRGPVPSETGFGIGLYQTSRLAEISGFSLQLRENEQGRVCFSLREKCAAARAGSDRSAAYRPRLPSGSGQLARCNHACDQCVDVIMTTMSSNSQNAGPAASLHGEAACVGLR